MFKNYKDFLNILKKNKKLLYAFSVFIALVLLALLLKLDTNNVQNKTDTNNSVVQSNDSSTDEYVQQLEIKLNNIIKQINGVENVKSMIYTKCSTKLEPIYDESINSEINTDTSSDGIKRETNRNTTQKQIKTGNKNQVLEKYYEYPEIKGVLVVVDYSGDENIYKILMNSIRVLLDVKINNIEIIVCNKKGEDI